MPSPVMKKLAAIGVVAIAARFHGQRKLHHQLTGCRIHHCQHLAIWIPRQHHGAVGGRKQIICGAIPTGMMRDTRLFSIMAISPRSGKLTAAILPYTSIDPGCRANECARRVEMS